MIQEIINYTKHLKENSPKVFEEGLEPSKGLHIFVELDEEGNAINFPGERGVDWDYYDGKNKTKFLKEIVPYHLSSTYVTMNKQKKFDKKQKIHSSSPYALEFNFNFNDDDKKSYGIITKPSKENKVRNDRLIKSKRIEIVSERLDEYFENTLKIFNIEDENKEIQIKFKEFLKEKLNIYISQNLRKFIEIKKVWDKIKEKEYCKIYFKNVELESYEKTYAPYLEKNIFNKEKYNLNSGNEIYGAIDYYTTFADGKIFLKHKTGISKDGVSYRYTGEQAKLLNLFKELKKSKLLPNPLPLFIDRNEFKNSDEMIRFFRENSTLKYSQILKKVFEEDNNRVLQNYYLLYFSGLVIEDFDFVSKFRYSFKENGEYPQIKNLFDINIKKEELKSNYPIKNIFHFEADIVKTIFNGVLVGGDINGKFWVNYFNEIKPHIKDNKGEELSESIYQMILKYRKAFYDYIYKSKTQAINSIMWNEIMWNSILGDLRNTNFDKKYFIAQGIKEKLNIWFSLYNYFTNSIKRIDMASKIPELLEKMKQVANNDNEHFDTTEEFAFGAGQVIYFLLNQSKTSEKTHALLEPFIQKVNAEQLQNSIAQTVNMYKHELSFGHGRFERLSKEVLAYETDDNLKNYQRLLLAGYFATPVIYEKKEENN
jgi:CRISPR-associated protein Csh1